MSNGRYSILIFCIVLFTVFIVLLLFFPVHRTGRPNHLEYTATEEESFESIRDMIQNTFSEFKPCLFLEKGQVLTFNYKVNLTHGRITVFIMQHPTRGLRTPKLIEIHQSMEGRIDYIVKESGLYELATSLYAFRGNLEFSWEIRQE